MVYGVVSPKIICNAVADDTSQYTFHHDADVIAAGGFALGAGEQGEHPSKKYFKMRHFCLKNAAGTKRCTLPANATVYLGTPLGATVNYGGIAWTVTGKVGERSSV